MADSAKPHEISLARYREYLRSLARARVDPPLRVQIDPSDIVQETLLKAHCAIEKFRGRTERQLTAWLKAILTNTLKNALRAFGRRNVGRDVSLSTALEQSSAQLGDCLAHNERAPEELVFHNEQLQRLAQALAQLPNDQRCVVDMKYLQGWSVAEICERTGRSKSSVVGLIYRGTRALRGLLD